MTIILPVVTLLIGILSGALSVLAGGGATVVIPVLLALGLTADQANATSRFNLVIGGLIATIILARKKKIEWKTVGPLLGAAVIGAFLGAWLGTMIHSREMLTIIVLTSVVSMILVYVRPRHWLSTAHSRALLPGWAGIAVYFALCVYGGIVAVDSAILRLIALVLVLGLPLSKANPIKVVTGLALFAVSTIVYGDAGKLDWPVAGWLAVGTAIGSYVASGYAGSDAARKWVYLILQISVTIETLLLVAQWLGWLPPIGG